MVAAAAIIIILVFGFWHNHRSNQIDALMAVHFPHVESPLDITRSSDDTSRDLLKERAYNLYSLYLYREAAPLLKEHFDASGDEHSLFLAALSHIRCHQIKKAESILASINDRVYKQQIEAEIQLYKTEIK